MSAMDIDRPLDDMIQAKRLKNRGQGGVARRGGKAPNSVGPVRNTRSTAPPVAPRAAPASVPAAGANSLQLPAQVGGSKIIVSNLPVDVTENQIRELFQTTVGPVSRVAISYDNRGQSKGVAQVEFRRSEDAAKAFQQYNKRLIDQSRPMKVEVIIDPTRMPPPPLTTRVGPAPKAKGTLGTVATGGSTAAPGNTGATNKRRSRGKKEKQDKPKPKTAAELDAEMEDYSKGATKA